MMHFPYNRLSPGRLQRGTHTGVSQCDHCCFQQCTSEGPPDVVYTLVRISSVLGNRGQDK